MGFRNATKTMMDKAIMFSPALEQQKTRNLLKILDAFDKCIAVFRIFGEYAGSITSERLKYLSTPGQGYQPFEELYDDFISRFDKGVAQKEFGLRPREGHDQEWD